MSTATLAEVPSPRQPSLASALIAAQREAKSVEKDSTNTFHKYAYASAESVMAEARTALNAAGLAVIQTGWSVSSVDIEWTDEKGATQKDQERTLHVGFALLHESGERIDSAVEVPILPEKGRPLDKALFAALTYAESYYLRGALCLPRVAQSDNIDDRDDTRHEPRRAAKSAPVAAPRAAKAIPNKHAAPCLYCNADVAAGDGFARQEEGGQWRVIHKACRTALQQERAGAPEAAP